MHLRHVQFLYPLLLVTMACSPGAVVRDVVKDATPAAVSGTLSALDDPANQKHLAHIVASPEARALRNELIDGTVGQVVQSTTRGVAREALRPQTEHDIELIVGRIMRASANGLSDAELSNRLAGALQNDLGPALQVVARENIGPAMAQLLEGEQFQRAYGMAARNLGRELVIGVQQGLTQTQDSRPPGEPSLLTRMTSAATTGAALAGGVTWVLAGLAILFAVWTLSLTFKVKRHSRDNEERLARARLLREAGLASAGKPWSQELLDALEERYRADDEATLRAHGARSRARPSKGENGVHA